MAGNVRQSAFHSYMLPICSLLLRLFPFNVSKFLRALCVGGPRKRSLGGGVGGWGWWVFSYLPPLNSHSPPPPPARLRYASSGDPPHKGEGRTEFDARIVPLHVNDC